jgi:TRAP transporter TAXI family solute receptor
MRTLFVACVGMVLTLTGVRLAEVAFPHIAVVSAARAQAIPKSLEPSGTEYAVRERKNAATVGVAGGLLSGTYMKFADELAQVLDDGDKLRVLPIVTYGAASNLDDLLYLRGVDVAITQSDVFEYFRTQRKISNLDKRVNYIIRLPVSELHVLARNEIKSIQDLRGKKVNFGPAGSGSSLTGSIVFQRLGVQVEQVLLDNPTAMQKLKSGEISALVRVIGKPIDVFEKIPANSGLHFVPIPFSKTFADYYTVGELTRQDYPTLIGEGERVDTIAVPAVLAAYNWAPKTDRYRKVALFVDNFFAKFPTFQNPPFHPKWKEVSLSAPLAGWQRFPAAQQWLDGHGIEPVARGRFDEFLKQNPAPAGKQPSSAEKDALFKQFQAWQAEQQNNARAQVRPAPNQR